MAEAAQDPYVQLDELIASLALRNRTAVQTTT
jgi:hypothetical protein